jgi:hypothetical protein
LSHFFLPSPSCSLLPDNLHRRQSSHQFIFFFSSHPLLFSFLFKKNRRRDVA